MANFPLPVKAEMSDAMKLPSRDLQFGDGYEQLGSDGLNRIEETWEVTVVIANSATSDLFQAFAIEHGQHKPFQWQSPRNNSYNNYIIDGAISGTKRNGGGSKPVFFTRSMRFKRVGNAIIQQQVSISIASPSALEDDITLQSLIISLSNYNSLENT